jgi:hypothetical protein
VLDIVFVAVTSPGLVVVAGFGFAEVVAEEVAAAVA